MNSSTVMQLLAKQNNTRNFSHLKTGKPGNIRPDILRSNILEEDDRILPLIGQQLNTIIDLRISAEGGGQENAIFTDANIDHIPIAFGNFNAQEIDNLFVPEKSRHIESLIENGYRTFALLFRDEIRQFFSILLNAKNLPLVFHCSAGKDRTGVLAALFLTALGVSKEDVILDYMETNKHVDAKGIAATLLHNMENKQEIEAQPDYFEKISQTLEILMSVRRSWIETVLDGIIQTNGSVECYLEDEIGLNIDELRKIYIINSG